MLDLKQLKIQKVSETDNTGVFEVGPLPKGYANTISNPIRRILLSSLEGGAITAIKIAGVSHEYSTLAGLQDDLLKLTLKLKGVAVRCYSDEPIKATVSVKAPKGEVVEVKAGDIETNPAFEVINKDYVISTISDGSKFEAELTIEKGVGFKAADSSKREEIGLIPLDGAFSPVENVEVKIANVRVGHRTDFEEVVMTITTNGVVTPAEALAEAMNINVDLASRLQVLANGDYNAEEVTEAPEAAATETVGVFVKNLKLSTRLRNSLVNAGVSDLALLSGKTKQDLLELKGMGQKSVDELIAVMQEQGLVVND